VTDTEGESGGFLEVVESQGDAIHEESKKERKIA